MRSPDVYDRGADCARKPDARERLARDGPSALCDADLLAAILGTGSRSKGVRTLAEEVLDLIGEGGPPPSASTLRKVGGMGEAKACAIAACLELGRRLYGSREKRIGSPADVWPIVAHWADRKQERFVCCSLNGAHEILAARVVSVGLVNRTVVHPREVFADPIVDRACAIVIDETDIPYRYRDIRLFPNDGECTHQPW